MSGAEETLPRPCGCGGEVIGLSDGSSVHGWRCSKCGHEWPRQVTVRGMARFNYVKAGGGMAKEWAAYEARRAALREQAP